MLLVGAISLAGAFVLSYERSAELLNFGAFIAFMGVNAAAFVRYYVHERQHTWSNFLPPVLGFVICGFIWLNLSPPAKLAGTAWVLVGIAYGAWRTRGFRRELVRFEE